MSDNNPTADEVIADESREPAAFEQNLKSKSTWLRLLFMILFGMLANLAAFVLFFVAVLGFLSLLFTGEINRHLQRVGRGIAGYLSQIVLYLTFNTDERPFPLGAEWPSDTAAE